MYTPTKIERFNENVLSKYLIYNSVFMTLPFDAIDNTGVLLPIFTEICNKGFKDNKNPVQIMSQFSEKFLENKTENEIIDLVYDSEQGIQRKTIKLLPQLISKRIVVEDLFNDLLKHVNDSDDTGFDRRLVVSFLEIDFKLAYPLGAE